MANIYELDVASSNCVHEVVTPPEVEFSGLADPKLDPSYEPAREYPFKLDPFQERSILCIDNEQSVLVSAHTSAGKTVVAEYAIAKSLKRGQRCIYTTPIKALSNQKYREFDEKFQDVGLITGDVTINPSASCLIMTTEILRNMLFRGNEIMREVGWVIFDEIHYMRDKERGVVWEETIILLPDNCHYVFLSATIPNARQFAEWISYIHHQTCHVVYTDYRPVPLEHHIFAGGLIYKVVDSDGNLLQDKFETAMSHLETSQPKEKDSNNKRRYMDSKEDTAGSLERVVKAAKGKNLVPILIFSFSKKECEIYATKLKNECFNNEEEKRSVDMIFKQAISVLSEGDKKLCEGFRNLLQNGVGIHHGGLLPIIKEVTEILFGEGLIKTLFATETFAMGLNMPAKTVVFTNVRKFDGKDFRYISSGEYIQMSGRAGRRGLDDRGIVILMLDEKITSAVGKNLLQGKPDCLNSAFHLTYNMVLNLLRVEGVDPDYMLEQSFYHFQNLAKVPQLESEISALEKEHSAIKIDDETKVTDYMRTQETLKGLFREYYTIYQSPDNITRFLGEGRPIKIVLDDGTKLDWGMCLGHQVIPRKRKGSRKEDNENLNEISIDVLIAVDKENYVKTSTLISPGTGGSLPVIAKVAPRNIINISAFKVKLQDDLRSIEAKESVIRTLNSIKKRTNGSYTPLDPIEEMGIKSENFVSIVKKISVNENILKDIGEVDEQSLILFNQKREISEQIVQKKKDQTNAKNSVQLVELKNMKSILRKLGYCSGNDVIDIKGRVACEITSGDELVLTEMLFNGAFNNLSAHQCNALLSCFVFDEKIASKAKLIDELAEPLKIMQDLAKHIAVVSKDAELELDEQEYINKFKPNLMDVVYAWSQGTSFVDICKMTDAYVGTIVRCMRRLEELLRQMSQASKVIGNTDLENKFADCIVFIKRDIIFAASLYL